MKSRIFKLLRKVEKQDHHDSAKELIAIENIKTGFWYQKFLLSLFLVIPVMYIGKSIFVDKHFNIIEFIGAESTSDQAISLLFLIGIMTGVYIVSRSFIVTGGLALCELDKKRAEKENVE